MPLKFFSWGLMVSSWSQCWTHSHYLKLFLFWWWLLGCVYSLLVKDWSSHSRKGWELLAFHHCDSSGDYPSLMVMDIPHMRIGGCVRWRSGPLPPIWESSMTIRVSGRTFSCLFLWLPHSSNSPLSSLKSPPELVPRVPPCTSPVLQSPSQTLTLKNKTCDSCVQEWSEREGPPVRVFGAEVPISRVTMRTSSLVWCGSVIGPGIREQDNFKTLFLMNWVATVKINALAGTKYKNHLRNIGK